MSSFLKNKFLLFITIIAVFLIYVFLFAIASETKFFSVVSLLDNLSYITPFAVPLFVAIIWTDPNHRTTVLRMFVQTCSFFIFFLILTLPFFMLEFFINDGLFAKIILSSYFALIMGIMAYTSISLLILTIFKNTAVITIFSFLGVLAFHMSTFDFTNSFYNGFFDIYNAIMLIASSFVFLMIAFVISKNEYSIAQKVVYLVALFLGFSSVYFILLPFKPYLFIDASPVPTFILTDEAKKALYDLPENVTVTISLPKKTASEKPQYNNYAKVLSRLLHKMQLASNGKLQIENRIGLFTDGNFSLKISSVSALKPTEIVLPGNLRGRGDFEKELMKAIQETAGVKKKVIGLATTLPIDGVQNKDSKLSVPRWSVMNLVREYYDVVQIPFTEGNIPENVDALMIVNPKASDEKQIKLFTEAFDNFMKKNGNAVIFADVFSESESAYPMYKNNGIPFTSKLVAPFGISIKKRMIAINRSKPTFVIIPDKNGIARKEPFIARFGIDGDGLNASSDVLRDVSNVNITSAGILEYPENGQNTLTVTPLMMSEYEEIDWKILNNLKSPAALLTNAVVQEELAPIAVQVSGTYGKSEIDLFVVADSDILYDQFWKDVNGNPIADNGVLLLNILDKLTGRQSFDYREETKADFGKVDYKTSMILWGAACTLSLMIFGFLFGIIRMPKNKSEE